MSHPIRPPFGRRTGTVLALATVAFAAACSSSSNTASTNNNNQAPTGTTNNAADQATLNAVYKGTLSSPDTTPRPGVKGKKIVIISSGQSSISSSIPVNAAKEAAQALGWQVTVYDAQLNPANDPSLMSQALASGADGVVLDAIDCSFVKSQLEQAKAKHVFVVPIYAYDCNDPFAGKGGKPLFSAYTNYGPEANKNLGFR